MTGANGGGGDNSQNVEKKWYAKALFWGLINLIGTIGSLLTILIVVNNAVNQEWVDFRKHLKETDGNAREYKIVDWFDQLETQENKNTLIKWYNDLEDAISAPGLYSEVSKNKFNSCIELLPTFPAGYLGLAYWHHGKAIELSERNEDWRKTLDHAKKAEKWYIQTREATTSFFKEYSFSTPSHKKTVYIGETKKILEMSDIPKDGVTAMFLVEESDLNALCSGFEEQCKIIIETQKKIGMNMGGQ